MPGRAEERPVGNLHHHPHPVGSLNLQQGSVDGTVGFADEIPAMEIPLGDHAIVRRNDPQIAGQHFGSIQIRLGHLHLRLRIDHVRLGLVDHCSRSGGIGLRGDDGCPSHPFRRLGRFQIVLPFVHQFLVHRLEFEEILDPLKLFALITAQRDGPPQVRLALRHLGQRRLRFRLGRGHPRFHLLDLRVGLGQPAAAWSTSTITSGASISASNCPRWTRSPMSTVSVFRNPGTFTYGAAQANAQDVARLLGFPLQPARGRFHSLYPHGANVVLIRRRLTRHLRHGHRLSAVLSMEHGDDHAKPHAPHRGKRPQIDDRLNARSANFIFCTD